MEKKYHNNNIVKFLGERKQIDMAKVLNVPYISVKKWVSGERRPNRWIMPTVLAFLGQPHGRVLAVWEVWPDEIKADF